MLSSGGRLTLGTFTCRWA